MANDDAPHGGRHNYIDVGPDFTGNLLRQRPGEAACALRIHQHAGALQIIGAALSRREDKMALQQRLCRSEFSQNLFIIHVIAIPPVTARLIGGGWPKFNRSEEHTSELQSLMRISYAVFCLKKKNKNKQHRLQDRQIYLTRQK